MNLLSPPRALAILLALHIVAWPLRGLAIDADGFRVLVTESTMERDSTLRGPHHKSTVSTKTLKTTIRNLSMQPTESGTLSYAILLRPWHADARLRKLSGTEPLPSIGGGRELIINIGAFEIRDNRVGRHRAEDEVAGWQITLQTGNRTVVIPSSPAVAAMLTTAQTDADEPMVKKGTGAGRKAAAKDLDGAISKP